MELRGTTATHVGHLRDENEDRAYFGGFVAVVADGMGGHIGGEMAAQLAIHVFADQDTPLPDNGLVQLAEQANRLVFERASEPEFRGMGTTLVALTLLPEKAKMSIVNVGDSRAYILSDGAFTQLTMDHSLVEDLVRQGRLTKDEALVHPQRNILTRALGISHEVEVDRFLIPTKAGDRFLLCSDGLFNEVDEQDIAALLGEHDSPDAAANALVAAALDRAGRDNITVAVVDVVRSLEGIDDAPAATIGSASSGDDGLDPHGTLPQQEGDTDKIPLSGIETADSTRLDAEASESVTKELAVTTVDDIDSSAANQTRQLPVVTEDPPAGQGLYLDPSVAPEHVPVQTISKSRWNFLPSRFQVLLMMVLAMISMFFLLDWYAHGSYFVGVEDGQVMIYKGRPGWTFVFEPDPERATDIDVDTLNDDSRILLQRSGAFSSASDAVEFVEQLTTTTIAPAPNDPLDTTTTTVDAEATTTSELPTSSEAPATSASTDTQTDG